MFILCLHDQEPWRAYGDPIQPAWRNDHANAYVQIQINKELNLFLSRGCEHLPVLPRWNRFM